MDLDSNYFKSLDTLMEGGQQSGVFIGFKRQMARESMFDEESREFMVQSEIGQKKINVVSCEKIAWLRTVMRFELIDPVECIIDLLRSALNTMKVVLL